MAFLVLGSDDRAPSSTVAPGLVGVNRGSSPPGRVLSVDRGLAIVRGENVGSLCSTLPLSFVLNTPWWVTLGLLTVFVEFPVA